MDGFLNRREEIRSELARALGNEHLEPGHPDRIKSAQEADWLQTLYGQLRTHLEGDLNRQWGILRIFVPLSLAPFAAVVVADTLTRSQIVLLGFASTALLLAANVFSDRLSLFTSKTWAWLGAIEAEWGAPQLSGARVTKRLPVSKVRWALQILLIGMWTTITVLG